ncbi:MAG: Hsp20/alpha crystallin family protein [Elusimicrobia bacterium]|nr:Hsp20/alpha crystallin family protein [Elusimicrobiota bacterium]
MNELIKLTDNLFKVKNDLDGALKEILENKESAYEQSWTPQALTCENEDEFRIYLSLPFSAKENINVSLKENILTIEGESAFKNEKKMEILRNEINYGRFFRAFRINQPVKNSAIKASYKDGVLEIILPKSEEAKPNKINIE